MDQFLDFFIFKNVNVQRTQEKQTMIYRTSFKWKYTNPLNIGSALPRSRADALFNLQHLTESRVNGI
jgi:hypothetical protein